MECSENVRAAWNVAVIVTDVESGEVVETQRVHNRVTLAGLNVLRDLLEGTLADVASGTASHVAVGGGSTAVSAGQTALVDELHRAARSAADTSDATLTVSLFVTSSQLNGETLQEAGLFTASSGGTMLARVVHAPIVKTSSLQVTYVWALSLVAEV